MADDHEIILLNVNQGAEPITYQDIDRLEIRRDNAGNLQLILWREWVSGLNGCYHGMDIYKHIIIKEPEQKPADDHKSAQDPEPGQMTFDDIL